MGERARDGIDRGVCHGDASAWGGSRYGRVFGVVPENDLGRDRRASHCDKKRRHRGRAWKHLFGETFRRLDALVGDWKVLGALKMMIQKMDADGVRSKYTDEELRSTLPDGAWRLLEKHRQQGSGIPEALQGA